MDHPVSKRQSSRFFNVADFERNLQRHVFHFRDQRNRDKRTLQRAYFLITGHGEEGTGNIVVPVSRIKHVLLDPLPVLRKVLSSFSSERRDICISLGYQKDKHRSTKK